MHQDRSHNLYLWIAAGLLAIGLALLSISEQAVSTQKQPHEAWGSTWLALSAYALFAFAVVCVIGAVRDWHFPLARIRDENYVRRERAPIGDYLPRIRLEGPKRWPLQGVLSGLVARDPGFAITWAQYGVADRVLDPLERLRALIVNGEFADFTVTNETMGGDPALGEGKELTVHWRHNGKKFSRNFKEGTHVLIPDND